MAQRYYELLISELYPAGVPNRKTHVDSLPEIALPDEADCPITVMPESLQELVLCGAALATEIRKDHAERMKALAEATLRDEKIAEQGLAKIETHQLKEQTLAIVQLVTSVESRKLVSALYGKVPDVLAIRKRDDDIVIS